MPLCLANAAFTSSSAFFIDAAANTVMVFCCALAGAAANRLLKTKTTKNRMAVHHGRRLAAQSLFGLQNAREPPFQAQGARGQRAIRRILAIRRVPSKPRHVVRRAVPAFTGRARECTCRTRRRSKATT